MESKNNLEQTLGFIKDDVIVEFRSNNIKIAQFLIENPDKPIPSDLIDQDNYLGELLSKFADNK